MENNQLQRNTINFDNLPAIDSGVSKASLELYKGSNDVNAMLQGFAQYLNISKRIQSENTKRNYINNVKQFLFWCNKLNFPIRNVTKTLILRNLVITYERALNSTDLAQNSRALKQSSVRKFFEYFSFMHEDYNLDLRKSFSADWVSTSDGNAFKRQIRINEDVFNAVKDVVNLSSDINDKWIFFFLAWGCRRSEIVGIKVSDIDIINSDINVYQTKTKEVKKLPLPKWFSEGILNKNDVYLIHNNSKKTAKIKGKKPCSPQHVYDKIKQWMLKTKFKTTTEIAPHAFRRYFCSYLLSEGYSESKIALITGHKSIAMVAKYGYDANLKNNPIIKNAAVKD